MQVLRVYATTVAWLSVNLGTTATSDTFPDGREVAIDHELDSFDAIRLIAMLAEVAEELKERSEALVHQCIFLPKLDVEWEDKVAALPALAFHTERQSGKWIDCCFVLHFDSCHNMCDGILQESTVD
jgi:hypothetical protein